MQTQARPSLKKTAIFIEPKIHWCAIVLATWLASNAISFYSDIRNMVISDVVSAIIVAALAFLALRIRRESFDTFVQWSSALIAAWLMFAPLVFWSKSAVSYSTDIAAASLLVLCYWIIPHAQDEPAAIAQTPPGWNYNPSDWWQRIPLMALALIGFFISRYLACCQLGYTGPAWDPVFPGGTEKILHSEVSKAFIISDAGLGAVSYLIDALAGIIGNRSRWQTMPWMVLLFGVLVVPPGVVSIILVILQPVAVGQWCFLCLAAAFNMLFMVPFALDEVIATCQYLRRAKLAGHGYWKTICYGTKEYADTAPEIAQEEAKTSEIVPPAGLLISMVASGTLLAIPHFFNVGGNASVNLYIAGALSMTFSVVAFAEVCRTIRLLNPLLGMWLIASLMIIPGYTATSVVAVLVLAVLISFCSLQRGKIIHQYAGWNKYIK